MVAKLFNDIRTHTANSDVEKFNPYHDRLGRFSTAGGAASFTIRTKDPAKQSWADKGIEREKVRTSKEGWDKPDAKQESKPKSKPKQAAKQGAINEHGVPKSQVVGKDISETFTAEYKTNPSGTTVSLADQVAEKQGYKGKPTVLSKAEFDEASKRSGVVAYRTINRGNDYITNKGMSSKEFAKQLMYADEKDFALNADGGQAYGGGIYMAVNSAGDIKRGMPNERYARDSSTAYGFGTDSSVVKMTISPTAKIANYSEISRQLWHAPQEIQNQFGGDVGAYAAALGYDGVRAKDAGWNSDYLMVTNRTALVICDEVEDVSGESKTRITA